MRIILSVDNVLLSLLVLELQSISLIAGFSDGLVFVIVNYKAIGSGNRTLSSTVSTMHTRHPTSIVVGGTSSRVPIFWFRFAWFLNFSFQLLPRLLFVYPIVECFLHLLVLSLIIPVISKHESVWACERDADSHDYRPRTRSLRSTDTPSQIMRLRRLEMQLKWVLQRCHRLLNNNHFIIFFCEMGVWKISLMKRKCKKKNYDWKKNL